MNEDNKRKTDRINRYISNMVTPMGIQWYPTDFWFDDYIARVMLITQYPTRVKAGWMSKIANMQGVTCSMHLSPTNSSELIQTITKGINKIKRKMNKSRNQLVRLRAKQQYEDAEKLLVMLDQENEKIMYVTVVIMIMAKDKKQLEIKSKKVESILASSKIRVKTAVFRQEEALLAVSPYGVCPESIKEVADRNMPISTIAGSFPFNACEFNDGKGFIFGKNYTGGIILLDTWLRNQDRINSNWIIMGDSGVGKSMTVKHILLNEYARGTKIIIIDPEAEYKDLCMNLNGQLIDSTNLNANADFIVLDTHNLQETDTSIKCEQYLNILTWVWQQISNNKEEKIILVIDEAYLLVDSDALQVLQLCRNISKRIRKYNGALIVITHSSVDFLDESVKKYGQELLDNSTYKFLMGTGGKNLEELSKLMNLTEVEQDILVKKQRGYGLLLAGSKRVYTEVKFAEHELRLFGCK